jgi:YVTN family beta-propeller protein
MLGEQMRIPRILFLLTTPLIYINLTFAQVTSTYQVGAVPSVGGFAVPTNQIVTPAGAQLNFNGRPLAIAVRPDHKTAAILNTGAGGGNFPTSPIAIVDLVGNTLKQQFSPANGSASYDGVLYSADGKHLYFSQDNGTVTILSVATDGTVSPDAAVALPTTSGAVNNGGLALSSNGKTLYVVMNMANSVGIIDLTTNKFTGQIAVQNAPKSIVVVGNFAYVTNEGGRPAKPGEYTDASAGTPIVADKQSASSTTGTVSVINLSKQEVVKNIVVGLHPTAILAADGYVFVANTNSDSVSVIDPATNLVSQTLQIQVFENAPFGSSPNGLAMTSEKDLAVSLGANNALALYKFSKTQFKFKGFVPTAWYPSSVADVPALTAQEAGTASPLPERLLVTNTKGVAVGPTVPQVSNGLNTHSYVGSVSIATIPTKEEYKQFATRVADNNGWSTRSLSEYAPKPFRAEQPIKHVIYVIKENRTYDQILGDDPRGNGDPTLVQFGAQVTPNQHAIADNFVLFDNFYDSGVLSADGHQWTDQAIAPDYIEKQFTDFNRSYPYNGGDSMVYAPTGFIWMDALNNGKSVGIYGEYAPTFTGPSAQYGTWSDWYNDSLILEGKKAGTLHAALGTFQSVADVPSVEKHLNPDFPNFNTGIPDQYRLDIFLKDFKKYVKNNDLPNLVVMTLCTDHTSGGAAGDPTDAAQVADNDLAVGRLVDEVSHSPFWESTAIVIVEDDPQAGVDHVDGHRSTAFIVSPYTQRHQVNHTFYTQINLVRTIEGLLGLPPMNQHDMLAAPMMDAFEDTLDLTPYNVIANKIPLDTITPAATSKLQKAWQKEVAKYLPHGLIQKPDVADPNLLNHAIWYSTKGFSTPYPGESKVLYPKDVKPLESARRDSDDDER